jgi:hypothetical protein
MGPVAVVRQDGRFHIIALLLACVWMTGFVRLAPTAPPREHEPTTYVSVNHWPEPCETFAMGGRELPPVKVELGPPILPQSLLLHVDFDLTRAAFAERVRERVDWMAYELPTDYPRILGELHKTYIEANLRAKLADALHSVCWFIGLMLPPLALFGAAEVLRGRMP